MVESLFPSLNSQGGKTLLMVAAEEDERSVVAVLLEHKAKMDLTDAVSACTLFTNSRSST